MGRGLGVTEGSGAEFALGDLRRHVRPGAPGPPRDRRAGHPRAWISSGVLWVPAGMPPHKTGQVVTPARHRAAMVELAIAGNRDFRMSRVELERRGPSYSVDTVRELTAAGALLAGSEPVLLLSSEALRALPSWHEPEQLISLAPDRRHSEARLSAAVVAVDRGALSRIDRIGSSCSRVRGSATHRRTSARERRAGDSIRYLVPEDVRNYIETNRLYPPELWSKN